MRPAAFASPGRFFKGNLHCHSTRSDGRLDVAPLCAAYRDRGYDFLAVTDHFLGLWDYPITDTRAHRTEGFTTLIGAELHAGQQDNGQIWHVLAVGLPDDFAPSDSPDFIPRAGQESAAALARRAREAGAFVAIAHPEWSGLTEADMRHIDAAHAVEVYNHGCAVESHRPHGLHAADILAREGRRMSFVATDDSHFGHGEQDAFGGWVMVKAPENTPEALLAALKAGAMYSSTGPEFHDLLIENGTLQLATSPVSAVIVLGQNTRTPGLFGEDMTEARIDLSPFADSPWIRVSIADRQGRMAWTNPIWLD